MFELITKEDYLDQRKQWKNDYKVLAADIKALKVAQRLAAKGGYSAASRLMSLRKCMSNDARDMMDELEVLKYNCRISVAFERFMEQQNEQV